MCKKIHTHKGGFILLLVVSIIIVFLIEIFNVFPDKAKGIKNILLGLSYGYISGTIVYFFTVKYPELLKKDKYESDIDNEIDNLASLLLRSLYEVNLGELTLLNDNEQWRTRMASLDWNRECGFPHCGLSVLKSLNIEFDKVQKEIVLIETMYKDYLSDDVNSALMSMYNSDVFCLVDDLTKANVSFDYKMESGDNRSIVIDKIIELMDAFKKVSLLFSSKERSGFNDNGMVITWPR